jgi:hypothetical protein
VLASMRHHFPPSSPLRALVAPLQIPDVTQQPSKQTSVHAHTAPCSPPRLLGRCAAPVTAAGASLLRLLAAAMEPAGGLLILH